MSKTEVLQIPLARIPLDQITPSEHNPRTLFDDERITELAESMRTHGQLQPIMLRKTKDGYTIIVGERRYRAAKQAGWKTIDATVMAEDIAESLSEVDMLFVRLEENLKREALSPLEQANAFAEAKKLGMTVEQIAKRLTLSERTVYNTIRLLQLSFDMREMLKLGRITPAHCERLLRIEDENERQDVFAAILHEDMSVRRLDEFLNMRAPSEDDSTVEDEQDEESGEDEAPSAEQLKAIEEQQAAEEKQRKEAYEARQKQWQEQEEKQEAALAAERELRMKAMRCVVQRISEAGDSGAVHELAGYVQRQITSYLARSHDDSVGLVCELLRIERNISEEARNTQIRCRPFPELVAAVVVLEASDSIVPRNWEMDSDGQFGEDRRIEIFETLLARFGKSMADMATPGKKKKRQ